MSAGTVLSPLGLGCSDEKEDSLGMTSKGTFAFPAAASQAHSFFAMLMRSRIKKAIPQCLIK